MVKEIWRNGTVWTFTYDGKGTGAKCVEVRGTDDLLHYTFDYSDPHCTLVRDSLGYTKSFYHHNGRVIKYVDPEKVNGTPITIALASWKWKLTQWVIPPATSTISGAMW